MTISGMQYRIAAIVLGSLLSLFAQAADFDPFGTGSDVVIPPDLHTRAANDVLAPCAAHILDKPLDLADATDLALCSSPKTREAWANAKAQAAQIGVAQSAYLPQLSASATKIRGNYASSVAELPELDYQQYSNSKDASLNLTWTLYDFGARSAHLENARQLLNAANATQDGAMQAVFADTAQAYYRLQSARGSLDAAEEAQQAALTSFDAADAKYRAGVGSLADKLQAQTGLNQARLSRGKAEGDLKTARGTLAVAMGLAPNAEFTIAPAPDVRSHSGFTQSIEHYLELATKQHPSIAAARAQLDAAKADIDAARAEGLPLLQLTGGLDRNTQPGQYSLDTTTRTNTIGVQLRVPLFEGFGRSYRIQAAKAQAESKEAELAATERQVALDVWTAYQNLMTQLANLDTVSELLQSAQSSFDVAQGRYKAGVGTLVELLNAQTALANARQQKVQIQADLQNARVRLAVSLGQLDM